LWLKFDLFASGGLRVWSPRFHLRNYRAHDGFPLSFRIYAWPHIGNTNID
jgi:hypothetical protein